MTRNKYQRTNVSLPGDYPDGAPELAAARSQLAKKMGPWAAEPLRRK